MIVRIFGAIDLIAAALIYSGNIPGPAPVAGACIVLLLAKGVISIFPIPLYLPGFLMNLTDITAALLLYSGETQLPAVKIAVIFILLIKSVPSIVSGLFLAAGFLGSRAR